MVSQGSAVEAALVEQCEMFGARDLAAVVAHFSAERPLSAASAGDYDGRGAQLINVWHGQVLAKPCLQVVYPASCRISPIHNRLRLRQSHLSVALGLMPITGDHDRFVRRP